MRDYRIGRLKGRFVVIWNDDDFELFICISLSLPATLYIYRIKYGHFVGSFVALDAIFHGSFREVDR